MNRLRWKLARKLFQFTCSVMPALERAVLLLLIKRGAASANWHPIATAPTCKRVLVFVPDLDTTYVAWRDDDAADLWAISREGYVSAPSHWMPLPVSPQVDKSEAEEMRR